MTAVIELSMGIDREQIDKETYYKLELIENSFK